jgi:phosphoribosyl 1,2-cyclic phosphate phosphodiesterase
VLFTHHHADHCYGIDDLRAFCQMHKKQIPIYANPFVMNELNNKFNYAMVEPKGFWEIPVLKPHAIKNTFELFDYVITPIPVMHGRGEILGYRIGNLAYITDVSDIPDNSMKLLDGLEVLLLDCLRFKPHFTHFGFDQSVEVASKINARDTYFIHMTHDLEYDALTELLPSNIHVGYDGLKLTIN